MTAVTPYLCAISLMIPYTLVHAQGVPLQTIEGMVESISENHASLSVMQLDPKKHLVPLYPKSYLTLEVAKELQPLVKSFQKGDILEIDFFEDKGKNILQGLSPKSVEVSGLTRLWVVGLSALGLLALTWLFLRAGPINLLIGVDNRYSNSQFQIALWFAVLVVLYVSTNILRGMKCGLCFVGGVGLPENLVMLSGISAFTFATARGITAQKMREPNAAALKPTAATPHFLDNLFRNDEGRFDLGDFQMVVITLLAIAVYIVQAYKWLGSIQCLTYVSLPDVDSTILSLFGLGQGAYLAKKYLGRVGES